MSWLVGVKNLFLLGKMIRDWQEADRFEEAMQGFLALVKRAYSEEKRDEYLPDLRGLWLVFRKKWPDKAARLSSDIRNLRHEDVDDPEWHAWVAYITRPGSEPNPDLLCVTPRQCADCGSLQDAALWQEPTPSGEDYVAKCSVCQNRQSISEAEMVHLYKGCKAEAMAGGAAKALYDHMVRKEGDVPEKYFEQCFVSLREILEYHLREAQTLEQVDRIARLTLERVALGLKENLEGK